VVLQWAIPALIRLALLVLGAGLHAWHTGPDQADQNCSMASATWWNPEKIVVQERSPSARRAGTGAMERPQELFGEKTSSRNRGAGERPALPRPHQDVWEQLRNPQLWLAAADRFFFSLGVGFGIIITYSSYLRKRDDVVLSGLSASAANEFCEVGLGWIDYGAALSFSWRAGIAGQARSGWASKCYRWFLRRMPFPAFLRQRLVLSAVPGGDHQLPLDAAAGQSRFLEEGLGLDRRKSVYCWPCSTGWAACLWFIIAKT